MCSWQLEIQTNVRLMTYQILERESQLKRSIFKRATGGGAVRCKLTD